MHKKINHYYCYQTHNIKVLNIEQVFIEVKKTEDARRYGKSDLDVIFSPDLPSSTCSFIRNIYYY